MLKIPAIGLAAAPPLIEKCGQLVAIQATSGRTTSATGLADSSPWRGWRQRDVLRVSPAEVEETADVLECVLEMPLVERRQR